MSYQERTLFRSYSTSSPMGQYEFASQPDASGRVGRAGAGARSVGVAVQAATAANQTIAVAYDGRVKVIAGGTIAAGAAVMSNASGRAITWTATNTVLGYATEAAVVGQVITIQLARMA